MMKFGTFFLHIDQMLLNGEIQTVTEALETLVPEGLSYVDMTTQLLGEKYQTKPLLKTLQDGGVRVASTFHVIDFQHQNPKVLEVLKEDTKLWLEQCAELECGMFMPVPTVSTAHPTEEARNECRKIMTEYIADIAEQSKAYGITTIVENFSEFRCTFSTYEDIRYILDNAPGVKYVLDLGNYWFGGNDILKACELFHQDTVHIHMKDLEPKPDGFLDINGRVADSCALGDGVIPVVEVLRKMKDYGYDKTATVEINDDRDLLRKVKKSLAYVKRMI